ncbi:MAG: choline BCCT transporter BetT [Nocardioides sp.]|nr:choline BCCT transporter BetT [Nocardioides sp.]
MSRTIDPSPPAFDRTNRKNPPVNMVVLVGAGIGTLAITTWALIAPGNAESVLGTVVGWTANWFGWFYVLLTAVILVFVIFLASSRYGKIKLGPEHSQPEFSTLSWASMLFAAGIGTDLMFFAVAEPVTQYIAPPSGEGETVSAAREATVWTLFHYGISGWGMYALMGMALAYFAYRLNLPLAIRSALHPIFGKRVNGSLGDAVDLAAILGTIFGVATSLGIGVVMVNVGLHTLFGVPQGTGAQIAIVVVGVVVATLSAVSGVDKGIRRLSELNVLMAILLTLWVLIAGKTSYLLDGLVLNIGDFIRLFPDMTLQTFAYEDTGTWMTDWTLFFWAWWIAWASFVGLFLARISRGRTIRQFVTGTLVIPFTYILMWVSIYGNAAIDRVRSGDAEFGTETINFPEQGFYTLLADYPAASFVAGLATLTALLFYVTSADSAALVMANLTSRLPSPQDDGAPSLRIFWAVTTGALTIAMLTVGGIGALQNATVIMGLPFAFVIILVMVGLYRALRVEAFRVDSVEHSLPGVLSGRAGPDGGARSWRHRLGRALSFPDAAKADEYESDVLLPTLIEVGEELAGRGVQSSAGRRDDELGNSYIELVADADGPHPFTYQVWRHEAPVPEYGAGRAVKGHDTYVRLEVFLGAGKGYDVMGFSKSQLLDDVLDQYEQHLEFLRLNHQAGL